MEKATIVALLEKYWQAETTVEEERALADWFNSRPPASLDPDLEPYHNLFAYFEEESRVSPGPDFESSILQAIGGVVPTSTPGEPAGLVQPFRWGMTAAAATVLVFAAGLYLFQPAKPTAAPSTTKATGNPANTIAKLSAAPVTDTYDNPEQALAAVRHALLIASVHLNEGRKQISNK